MTPRDKKNIIVITDSVANKMLLKPQKIVMTKETPKTTLRG